MMMACLLSGTSAREHVILGLPVQYVAHFLPVDNSNALFTWGHGGGTWPFMAAAAELIVEPHIPHSFLHDLKSAYFVLLSMVSPA
jgi:hypothetical protein